MELGVFLNEYGARSCLARDVLYLGFGPVTSINFIEICVCALTESMMLNYTYTCRLY